MNTATKKPAPATLFHVSLAPMGKPRMTQRDRWKKRPCVVKYHAWCDELRAAIPAWKLPHEALVVSWRVWLPMPASWSKQRKAELAGKPHRQKPDRDNIDKAILDALFIDDSRIAGAEYLWKFWADAGGPRMEIEIL
jgi:Holliday junction resolvase RusA-like endonuclease